MLQTNCKYGLYESGISIQIFISQWGDLLETNFKDQGEADKNIPFGKLFL